MRNNLGIWIGLALAGLAGLLLALNAAFPGSLQGESAQMRLVYGVGLLALVMGGFVMGWRENANLALKQALAWIVIILILVTGYSFRADFMGLGGMLGQRLAGELMPSRPIESAPGIAYLSRDTTGHFHADAMVNGTHIRFLVDTGASDVALSEYDAKRLGIDFSKLAFTTPYQTANGVMLGARTKLAEVNIGGISVRNVDASIMRGDIDVSLLGMSYLSQLSRFEVSGDRLILKQ
ncbi:MAG: TIGR02281 family clan AA aspartic protease [Parvibaculum sp.]